MKAVRDATVNNFVNKRLLSSQAYSIETAFMILTSKLTIADVVKFSIYIDSLLKLLS